MSEYRRFYQPGAYYFFTQVTYQRKLIFNDQENIKNIKISINKIKNKFPFSLNALVIMPDHLHCIWKLPENDHDFSTRWRLIKRHFSTTINSLVNNRNEKEIWQRRFWEHAIRDGRDFQQHMDYIHYNPVKHGLVKSPKDWVHSSFHYWVKKGIYELKWGADEEMIFTGMNEAE